MGNGFMLSDKGEMMNDEIIKGNYTPIFHTAQGKVGTEGAYVFGIVWRFCQYPTDNTRIPRRQISQIAESGLFPHY